MRLEWSNYKYFPYEQELALREVHALIGSQPSIDQNGDVLVENANVSAGQALTYFSSVSLGKTTRRTQQALLETSALNGRKRQSTRYSVHGLHEYRGKFNPQVCRALINILGLREGHCLLDPFCGSGTTLVEAAHRNVRGIGFDLNPLAVFIANAKLTALTTPATDLAVGLSRILARRQATTKIVEDARSDYLNAWFEPEILTQIEALKLAIEAEPAHLQLFFHTIASDLLRNFSLQEPADLRIRRRASACACEAFTTAFERSANAALQKLGKAQGVVGFDLAAGKAHLQDNRQLHVGADVLAQGAVTSPPYASALPYIDTQRLSLVWLRLLSPVELRTKEATLIGSRELSTSERRNASARLCQNADKLPASEIKLCRELQNNLSLTDGFRRQAVPILLYRYFVEMRRMFHSVASRLEVSAPFALIVGHNHSTIGGKKFDIDTPRHLASLALASGWSLEEELPLQAYQRFGLHASNGVTQETLLLLRSPSSPRR